MGLGGIRARDLEGLDDSKMGKRRSLEVQSASRAAEPAQALLRGGDWSGGRRGSGGMVRAETSRSGTAGAGVLTQRRGSQGRRDGNSGGRVI